jgi:hypothetical protein
MYRKIIYGIRIICIVLIPILIIFTDYKWYISIIPLILSYVIPILFYIGHLAIMFKMLKKNDK